MLENIKVPETNDVYTFSCIPREGWHFALILNRMAQGQLCKSHCSQGSPGVHCWARNTLKEWSEGQDYNNSDVVRTAHYLLLTVGIMTITRDGAFDTKVP